MAHQARSGKAGRPDSEKLPQLESSSREDDEAAQDSGFRGEVSEPERGEET